LFGIKTADPVEDYPTDLVTFLERYPQSHIAKWHKLSQQRAARLAELEAERRPLQERVRRCQAMQAEATPSSDFVALAAAKVEIEVLQRELDRLAYEVRRTSDDNTDAKFHNAWGAYTVRLGDVRNHREPGRLEWNDDRPDLARKLELLRETIK
jgi:hypothetical protein